MSQDNIAQESSKKKVAGVFGRLFERGEHSRSAKTATLDLDDIQGFILRDVVLTHGWSPPNWSWPSLSRLAAICYRRSGHECPAPTVPGKPNRTRWERGSPRPQSL